MYLINFALMNIEGTVARMHKSGILRELQEQYGRKPNKHKTTHQTKHLDSSKMQQEINNQECFQQVTTICYTSVHFSQNLKRQNTGFFLICLCR